MNWNMNGIVFDSAFIYFWIYIHVYKKETSDIFIGKKKKKNAYSKIASDC